MPCLAITGSLGSGKSLLLRELTESLKSLKFTVQSYSADVENRRLLNEDPGIREEIALRMGRNFLDAAGIPDTEKLRFHVQSDPSARQTLESIMHPRLGSIWLPLAQMHRGSRSSFFVAEIPLLYEKRLEQHFDRVLVIGCSEAIRKARLGSCRSIPSEQADRWLAIQQFQESKIALADHLFWNDGSLSSLQTQISQFLSIMQTS